MCAMSSASSIDILISMWVIACTNFMEVEVISAVISRFQVLIHSDSTSVTVSEECATSIFSIED